MGSRSKEARQSRKLKEDSYVLDDCRSTGIPVAARAIDQLRSRRGSFTSCGWLSSWWCLSGHLKGDDLREKHFCGRTAKKERTIACVER